MGFSDELRESVADVYAAIRVHPFLTGLTDGTLPHAAFGHFVVQDRHYLRGYARALAVLAARAPTEDDTTLFAQHAAGAIAAEQEMHAALSDALALDPDAPTAPTTLAYTSYLLATCHGGSFAEGLGAVLPCYWIYASVGEALLAESSPDPLYARWIAMYGGEEFRAVVERRRPGHGPGGRGPGAGRAGAGRRAPPHDVALRVDVLGRGLAPGALAGLTPERTTAGPPRRVDPPSGAGVPQTSARVERPCEREVLQLRCAYAASPEATPNPAPATTTMASNTVAILWLLLTACTRRDRWAGPSDPVGGRRLRIVGCCLHPPRRTRRSRWMFQVTIGGSSCSMSPSGVRCARGVPGP